MLGTRAIDKLRKTARIESVYESIWGRV